MSRELDVVHVFCRQANECLEAGDAAGAKKNLDMVVQIGEQLGRPAVEEPLYAYSNLGSLHQKAGDGGGTGGRQPEVP